MLLFSGQYKAWHFFYCKMQWKLKIAQFLNSFVRFHQAIFKVWWTQNQHSFKTISQLALMATNWFKSTFDLQSTTLICSLAHKSCNLAKYSSVSDMLDCNKYISKQTLFFFSDFVRFNVHLHEFCFTHLVHKVNFYIKQNPHVKKDKKS